MRGRVSFISKPLTVVLVARKDRARQLLDWALLNVWTPDQPAHAQGIKPSSCRTIWEMIWAVRIIRIGDVIDSRQSKARA